MKCRYDNHNDHKINEENSPGGSSLGNSSSKENHLSTHLRSSLDEDGFKPRIPLDTTALTTKNSMEGAKLGNKRNIAADKKFSSSTTLTKDVQFLLKVKRLRKKKLLEDAIVDN